MTLSASKQQERSTKEKHKGDAPPPMLPSNKEIDTEKQQVNQVKQGTEKDHHEIN